MLKKQLNRISRHNRVRSKIAGTPKRPRLAVFRSNAHISAQLIDDTTWKTLASSSDLKIKSGTKVEMAIKVWEDLAKQAKDLKIKTIVFDRWGFAYHGRVKALAEAAREWGLKF